MIHKPWYLAIGLGCFCAALVVAMFGITDVPSWEAVVCLVLIGFGVVLVAKSIGEIG